VGVAFGIGGLLCGFLVVLLSADFSFDDNRSFYGGGDDFNGDYWRGVI